MEDTIKLSEKVISTVKEFMSQRQILDLRLSDYMAGVMNALGCSESWELDSNTWMLTKKGTLEKEVK